MRLYLICERIFMLKRKKISWWYFLWARINWFTLNEENGIYVKQSFFEQRCLFVLYSISFERYLPHHSEGKNNTKFYKYVYNLLTICILAPLQLYRNLFRRVFLGVHSVKYALVRFVKIRLYTNYIMKNNII